MMDTSTKGQTPTFSKTVTVDGLEGAGATVVIRYYAPYGDAWLNPIEPMKVTYAGIELPLFLNFGGSMTESNYSTYLKGQNDLGYDQYAHYFRTGPFTFEATPQDLVISGSFEQLGYCNVVLYYGAGSNKTPVQIMDFEFDADLNPYIPGNPSVFAYPKLSENKAPVQQLVQKSIQPQSQGRLLSDGPFRDEQTGRVYFFRNDKAYTYVGEDFADDGCSRAYISALPLASPQDQAYQFMILRYKMPTTFVHQTPPEQPDTVFGDYQCRYVSVSANCRSSTPADQLLEFWTVNNAMLEKTKDADGYSYVFFAPVEYVRLEWQKQGSPRFTPPIMTWGRYSGYFLSLPDYAVIMRHRAPSPDWEGNVDRMPCYPDAASNQPINDTLGVYPSMYSGTVEDFINGHLGDVEQNSPWPSI
jgi:hypothetical protein